MLIECHGQLNPTNNQSNINKNLPQDHGTLEKWQNKQCLSPKYSHDVAVTCLFQAAATKTCAETNCHHCDGGGKNSNL